MNAGEATTESEMKNAFEEVSMVNEVIAAEEEVVVEEDAEEAASETKMEQMKTASSRSVIAKTEEEAASAAEAGVTEGAVEQRVKVAANLEVEDVAEKEAAEENAAVKIKATRRMLLSPTLTKKRIRN